MYHINLFLRLELAPKDVAYTVRREQDLQDPALLAVL